MIQYESGARKKDDGGVLMSWARASLTSGCVIGVFNILFGFFYIYIFCFPSELICWLHWLYEFWEVCFEVWLAALQVQITALKHSLVLRPDSRKTRGDPVGARIKVREAVRPDTEPGPISLKGSIEIALPASVRRMWSPWTVCQHVQPRKLSVPLINKQTAAAFPLFKWLNRTDSAVRTALTPNRRLLLCQLCFHCRGNQG